MIKEWYKSRTIWVAILQAVLGITLAFGVEYPEINTVGGVLVLKSVLDMVLRYITTEPIV